MFSWIKQKWTLMRDALASTRKALCHRLRALLGRAVDQQLLEELEEILYEADLGASIVATVLQEVRTYCEKTPDVTMESLLHVIEKSLLAQTSGLHHEWSEASDRPMVVIVIGANGSGKTTSIAKLAYLSQSQGKSVLLAAADTFRAAAQEQLSVWAKRLGLPMIRGAPQADPAAVAYDAIMSARAQNIDVLYIDTAGRLENRQNLLRELQKIRSSCEKVMPGAPHGVLLVLDATIGQNGIEQAKAFHQAIGVTGLVLTKLDGSAKGGVVIAIQRQLGIPVQWIGVGEQLEAMIPFDPQHFVHSLLFEEHPDA